jgi:branched-chain amino acid transport system permease protein
MFKGITSSWHGPRFWVAALVVLALFAIPIYALQVDQLYWLKLASRVLIYAIAAISLNLLIGYVGLVSFGHALYFMLGAYAVGLMQFHGITNGWLQLLAALVASVVIAVSTGWVCLRTQGMAFIMITLAFAQMFFFLGISLKDYGGDDGMRIEARSVLFPFDLAGKTTLYFVIVAVLLASLLLLWLLINSRFGYVLRGIKSNERRIVALGFPVMRYKLAAMAIAACICSVAGFLLANLTNYTSPSYGAWNISGELIVIVVLGGVGTLFGPLVGAIAFLLFEEILQSSSNQWLSEHWQLVMGATIVLIVITIKRGIYGSLSGGSINSGLLKGGSLPNKLSSNGSTKGSQP